VVWVVAGASSCVELLGVDQGADFGEELFVGGVRGREEAALRVSLITEESGAELGLGEIVQAVRNQSQVNNPEFVISGENTLADTR
jgi:hypothetical protein